MNKTEIAVFGGGCFWCTEAVFKMLRGIISAVPGYSGGNTPNPTYDEVCSGNTGHAEVVKIEFDPSQISFRTLLTVFFATHDPTTLNRQGNDVGTQYRSAVFYTTPEQKQEAENYIQELNQSSKEGKPVVTEVAPFSKFYEAEDYHKNYYANHKDQSYCAVIINPKLDKVQKQFNNLLVTQAK
jgi:peptide-methionine (S)-S-oxide reductase